MWPNYQVSNEIKYFIEHFNVASNWIGVNFYFTFLTSLRLICISIFKLPKLKFPHFDNEFTARSSDESSSQRRLV